MSPRDRRALVIGGAVVGLAILVLKIAPWGWRAVTERRAELEARVGFLERMRAEVPTAAQLEDSGVVVKGRLATLAPELLTGRTPAEATADLGARLAAVADHHRVRVSRTDPVIDSTGRGQLGQVAVRAALESDTRGLFGLLDAVSRGSAVLVVDSMRVIVADPLVPFEQPEMLRTELTIRGWFLPGRASR